MWNFPSYFQRPMLHSVWCCLLFHCQVYQARARFNRHTVLQPYGYFLNWTKRSATVLVKVWNLVWSNTVKIWKFQYLGVQLGIWSYLYLYQQDLMTICFFFYLQINISKLFENIWIWYFSLMKIQIKFTHTLLWFWSIRRVQVHVQLCWHSLNGLQCLLKVVIRSW